MTPNEGRPASEATVHGGASGIDHGSSRSTRSVVTDLRPHAILHRAVVEQKVASPRHQSSTTPFPSKDRTTHGSTTLTSTNPYVSRVMTPRGSVKGNRRGGQRDA